MSWCEKKFGPQYMTIECLEDGTAVNIINASPEHHQTGTFQIKLNDANDWTTVSWEDIGSGKDYNLISAVSGKSSMSKGDKLRFRNIDKWSMVNADATTVIFVSLHIINANAIVYGKLIDSLAYDFSKSSQQCKFHDMFSDSTALVDASRLDLDGIALGNSCYGSMFSGCTSLTAAPELPATTLADSCYGSMFSGCTSLTSAPELPATTPADNCYGSMFYGCISLVTAPELPATALAEGCYNSMFAYCTSLTSAPALPATALADGCYSYMFYGCAGLATQDINLPATTLAGDCYNGMFDNCGTASTKTVHIPTSLASEVTANTFGSNTGVIVMYDLK